MNRSYACCGQLKVRRNAGALAQLRSTPFTRPSVFASAFRFSPVTPLYEGLGTRLLTDSTITVYLHSSALGIMTDSTITVCLSSSAFGITTVCLRPRHNYLATHPVSAAECSYANTEAKRVGSFVFREVQIASHGYQGKQITP